MEVSALRYSGGMGLHGRSPLHRLQSDERLIALTRRGNAAAFEVLVSRYQPRLLAFCRHLLGSREDAEDVLQEVMAAAFNAILADDRPINVRPWLYRIARNRSLNHLRRIQAIGVDSMDIHLSDNGATTADKVHDREQFRLMVGDIHDLPETQRTALVLREMDALSYDQIAEAMETTVPGVKSLLVRARISLAEAAEARLLSCEEVRIELAEVAEGLRRRPSPLVRRHLRACNRCGRFQGQLRQTSKALAALLPIGPLALLRQFLIVHIGHSAGTGSGAAGATSAAGATGATGAAAGATGAGAGAGAMSATCAGAVSQAAAVSGAATGTATLGSAGGVLSAGAGAIASKAAASLAAAAIVTAGAVEASHVTPPAYSAPKVAAAHPAAVASEPAKPLHAYPPVKHHTASKAKRHKASAKTTQSTANGAADKTGTANKAGDVTKPGHARKKKKDDGRTQTQTDPTVLTTAPANPGSADTTSTTGIATTTNTTTTTPASPPPTTTTSDPTQPSPSTCTSTTSSSSPTPTDSTGSTSCGSSDCSSTSTADGAPASPDSAANCPPPPAPSDTSDPSASTSAGPTAIAGT
jgi:RNA polymerase sigma factor (sigma-70 family)